MRGEEYSLNEKKAKPLAPEELVSMYAGVIYRIAYSRLQNVHDAEDITQEVLLKYIKSDTGFKDEDHRRMWIIRVTVNAVNSLVRSAWRRHSVPLEDIGDMPCEGEDTSGIGEALKRLDEKYRVPIHLFYYENMTVSGIAEVLGCAEGTVKSLLSRGRNKLKTLLEEDSRVR